MPHLKLGASMKVDIITTRRTPASPAASIKAAVARVVNDWVEDYANKIDFKVDADQLIASITRDVK